MDFNILDTNLSKIPDLFLACSSKTGKVIRDENLGNFTKNVLKEFSKTHPKLVRKYLEKKLDIDSAKLTEFWHAHVDSGAVDKEEIKHNYRLLKERGDISATIPPKKITESVQEMFDYVEKNGDIEKV